MYPIKPLQYFRAFKPVWKTAGTGTASSFANNLKDRPYRKTH